MKRLAREIYSAVRDGRLQEPFAPEDVRKTCPGYARSTPGTFLPKHCVGKPGSDTKWFERTATGRYKTTAAGWREWSRVTGRPIPPGH
jgi:hypothetical protein